MVKTNVEAMVQHKENGDVLSGLVTGTKNVPNYGDVLTVATPEGEVYIQRDNIESKETKGSLIRYVSETVNFKVTAVDEEHGLVEGDASEVHAKEQEEFLENIKDGEPFVAKITNLNRAVGFLKHGRHQVLLRTEDFSTDDTPIYDKYNRGDEVEVKFKEVNGEDIHVEAVEKHSNPERAERIARREKIATLQKEVASELVEGETLIKKVVNVRTFEYDEPVTMAFVRVDDEAELDIFAHIRPSAEGVKAGDVVVVQVNEINKEEARVRGAVLEVTDLDEVPEF